MGKDKKKVDIVFEVLYKLSRPVMSKTNIGRKKGGGREWIQTRYTGKGLVVVARGKASHEGESEDWESMVAGGDSFFNSLLPLPLSDRTSRWFCGSGRVEDAMPLTPHTHFFLSLHPSLPRTTLPYISARFHSLT